VSVPELAAITIATARSRFVSHSWFEKAGKIGSPEYARVQYLFCASAIAVMVLLAVRNFWRASLLIALVGTALQVFVAYLFGAAMVLWSGVAVIALLLGGAFRQRDHKKCARSTSIGKATAEGGGRTVRSPSFAIER
jgi:hypothetical protein